MKKKIQYTSSHKKTVRLSIDCSAEERKMIKMLATMEDKSMGDFMLSLAHARFEQCQYGYSHIPNDETIASIEESEKGMNITTFRAAEDMFKYLHSLKDEDDIK